MGRIHDFRSFTTCCFGKERLLGAFSVLLRIRLNEYFIQSTDSAARAMTTEKQPALSSASNKKWGNRKSFVIAEEIIVLLE